MTVNALQAVPPVPHPQQMPQPGGGPAGNALAAAMGASALKAAPAAAANALAGAGGAPPPQAGRPAPTHDHAVAGVLHLSKIQRELGGILKDPDAGRKNIRPRVIDAAANLLGDGAMSMPEVLAALKSFPEDPKAQRAWVEKHLSDALDAQLMVLDHHAAACPGCGDFGQEWGAPREGDATANMKGLMGAYSRG